MSHDFPDGPDYNPEILDDDPWDTPYAHPDAPEVAPFCSIHGHVIGGIDRTCLSCGKEIPLPDATDDDLSDTDS